VLRQPAVVDADEVVGSTDRPGRGEVDAAGADRKISCNDAAVDLGVVLRVQACTRWRIVLHDGATEKRQRSAG